MCFVDQMKGLELKSKSKSYKEVLRKYAESTSVIMIKSRYIS